MEISNNWVYFNHSIIFRLVIFVRKKIVWVNYIPEQTLLLVLEKVISFSLIAVEQFGNMYSY